MKETREERFVRVAEARTNKLIHMIRLMGNLSAPVYAYSDAWIDQIFSKLRSELDGAEKRLRERRKNKRPRFSLGDTTEENALEDSEPNAPHWIIDTQSSYCCSVCGRKGKGSKPESDQLYCQYCGNKMVGKTVIAYPQNDKGDVGNGG